MKLLQDATERLRAALWNWGHRDFLVVFNWHQVAPEFDPARHHRYTWTRLDDFAVEIDFVAAEFRVLPLYQSITLLKRGKLRGACAALTFDDGDASIAEHVAPLLRRRGLPATFFINTAYFDGQSAYWFPVLSYFSGTREEQGSAEPPAELLDQALRLRTTDDPLFYDEVRSRVERFASAIPLLGARLVTPDWLAGLDGELLGIGAHGHEHQRYSMMSPEWQQNDLRENVRRLSQFRGFRPIFGVPFGRAHDWTGETIRVAHEQGLEVVLADGGINFAPGISYRRIPCDGRKVAPLFRAEMAGSRR